MEFLSAIAVIIAISLVVLFYELLFCFIIIIYSLSLGLFVLWIIALVDCAKRDIKDFAYGGKDARVLWILLLLFFRHIASIVYFFLIMYKKGKKSR